VATETATETDATKSKKVATETDGTNVTTNSKKAPGVKSQKAPKKKGTPKETVVSPPAE
jgi:hypothetical protein